MWIKELALRNFRNYDSARVAFSPRINVFVGNNAQGKTNLLEAVYILAMSKSYRLNKETELIKHGETSAVIQCRLVRDAEIALNVSLSQEEPKRLLVNGKAVSPRNFVGYLTCVLFSPEDLLLVKGSPALRRRFLDIEICQISAVYRDLLLNYQKILQQRNQMLKEISARKGNIDLLTVWNEQLVDYGTRIVIQRASAVKKLSLLSRLMHRRLTQGREELSVYYRPFFWEENDGEEFIEASASSIRDWFYTSINQLKKQELKRGFSMVGPQRDDLVLKINGEDARRFGSQGQQRTAILAMRLAELEFIRSETGHYPIMLLDDVMSELDPGRREFLLKTLSMDVQTIITTTDLDCLSPEVLADSSIFSIASAHIQQNISLK